jgi:hypothetical protein
MSEMWDRDSNPAKDLPTMAAATTVVMMAERSRADFHLG